MQETKQCTKCKEVKPLIDFYKDSKDKSGYKSSCKICSTRPPEVVKDAALRRKFGITLEEYNKLLAHQGGVCYICGKACTTGRKLAVDHDHDTGMIRGLLCVNCNKYVVGNLTLERVARVFEYMSNPPADAFFGLKRKVPNGMEKPKRYRRKRTVKRKNSGILRSR